MKTVHLDLFSNILSPSKLSSFMEISIDPGNKELMEFLCFRTKEPTVENSSQVENGEYERKKITIELELDHADILQSMDIEPGELYKLISNGGAVSFNFQPSLIMTYRMAK